MSKQSFADLGVSKQVVRALARRDITEPFAIQRLVIEDVMEGRDVLAKSPTGSGKTLAFGIPMVDKMEPDTPRPAGLVLAPTRELATQIVDELRDLGAARNLKVAAVYGGVGIDGQARAARRAQIVVATPGRLEDLLERRVLSLKNVRMLVLDEGDRMLDMGFRPAVDRIVSRCPRDRQTLFFSATLDGAAGWAAKSYTKNPVKHEHTPPQDDAVTIDHRFVAVEAQDRVSVLVDELNSDCERSLVFVRTKRGADRLVKRLNREGIKAAAMHGDKTQSQREKALAAFDSGRVATLVATDVAARGIDVDGISHVINFDQPEDRETYVHRVGRTGRAGRSGTGVTFVAPGSARAMEVIAHELKLHPEFKQSGLASKLGPRHPHAPRPGVRRRTYGRRYR